MKCVAQTNNAHFAFGTKTEPADQLDVVQKTVLLRLFIKTLIHSCNIVSNPIILLVLD